MLWHRYEHIDESHINRPINSLIKADLPDLIRSIAINLIRTCKRVAGKRVENGVFAVLLAGFRNHHHSTSFFENSSRSAPRISSNENRRRLYFLGCSFIKSVRTHNFIRTRIWFWKFAGIRRKNQQDFGFVSSKNR